MAISGHQNGVNGRRYWELTWADGGQQMKDLLILSKKTNVDVFNVLDVMENEQFLKKGPDSLKFGIGDGYLQYYLYNWRCPQIEPQGLGIVLL